MNVAFDATVLHGKKSGVGYYCEELLRSMAAQDHETDFFVFSHRPLNLNLPGVNGNVQCSSDRYFPIRAVYLHALLPGILDRVRPDVRHYTNFLTPITETHPYVVTVHDMGLESLNGCHPITKRLYTRNLIPRAARNARLILTNSEFSKWEIVRYLGISEDRIRVTPLAASPEFTPDGESLSVEPRVQPYFLYVGNLEPRKNLTRLIEAFARLKAFDHELWIVGDTWYRGGAVHERVRSLGLADRVRFLGYVPRNELPALYRGATAFVYPSLLEGFGLPVVEAMACGAPVITSNNSALKEIAADAAVLVDADSVRSIADAMGMLASEPSERARLRRRGIKRAAEFSWEKTAALTLDAYREAAGSTRIFTIGSPEPALIAGAIHKTLKYAELFEYPLDPDEIHERLFEAPVDRATFRRILGSLGLPTQDGFVAADPKRIEQRKLREEISDRAIGQAWPGLKFLSAIPFVRMLAFSGSTAHRNMTNSEDLDLFMIVEDGKLWFVFLIAIVWAKLRGVRKTFCLNYIVSDAALPLFNHDAFTAQQVASLKPFFGKVFYDRLLGLNPFVRRWLPNFDASKHRAVYEEINAPKFKRIVETALKCGTAQLVERLSRMILGRYLRRKVRLASESGACDVLLEPRRLKLHLRSHRDSVLSKLDSR